MRPAGILGPRLLPVRPFCPPFPFTGCCLRGLLDLFLGFDALAAGAAFAAGERQRLVDSGWWAVSNPKAIG